MCDLDQQPPPLRPDPEQMRHVQNDGFARRSVADDVVRPAAPLAGGALDLFDHADEPHLSFLNPVERAFTRCYIISGMIITHDGDEQQKQ